jgi:hypothetical protein
MTTENTSTDLIISYTVASDGKLSDQYSELKKSLNAGYRVVEIISTAQHAAGSQATGTRGGTCVTVLLVMPEGSSSTSKYVGKKNS